LSLKKKNKLIQQQAMELNRKQRVDTLMSGNREEEKIQKDIEEVTTKIYQSIKEKEQQ